jgi:exonuclease SbcC
MILNNLILNNFKKYKHHTIEFKEGLIGIIGKNGSGKSTIFEAILFALYGELQQKGAKQNIRNAYVSTKEVVSISLEFEFDNKLYKIIREFRGKSLSANAKLYKNNILEVSGAKETTSYITKLTKMNKEAFINTLFASQKELISLSTLKNEDRKKMIRKLLGLEKIDFVEKELIEKIRDLKRDIKASDQYLLSKEDIKTNKTNEKHYKQEQTKLKKLEKEKLKEIHNISKKLETIKKELEQLNNTKQTKQNLYNELTILKNSINLDKQTQIKLKDEIQQLKLKQKELDKILPIKQQYEQLEIKIKEYDKLKEYYLKKQGLMKEQEQLRIQYKKYSSTIKQLENESNNIDKLEISKKDLIDKLNNIDQQIQQNQTIKNDLLSKMGGEQKLIDDTKTKINNLQNIGKNSNCPTCTRPLLDEYDNVINSLNNIVQNTINTNIKDLKNQIDIYDQKINKSKKQKDNTQEELKQIDQQINIMNYKFQELQKAKKEFEDVNKKGQKNKQELKELEQYKYDQQEHKNIKEQQIELKTQYEHIMHLQSILKRYDKLIKDQIELEQKINKQTIKYQNDEKNYIDIKYDEKLHKQIEQNYEDILSQKQNLQEELNRYKINIAQIQGQLNTIEQILKNNLKQLEKVQLKQDDLNDYEMIKLNLAQFKTKINSKISPQISKIASDMYSTITKGKYQYIEVSDEFDFYIYDDGIKYPISRFSGGEIDLANLVLRIAISKTLSELNGTSHIGFLAFDEIFGSQDENRRLQILEAFHTIKEQYRQIFLISHEMEIKEMFEMVIEL